MCSETLRLALVATLALLAARATAADEMKREDPYLAHLRNAPEFERVPGVRSGRWDTWLYMPWRYQWEIGTGDEGGEFCREYGINGGFTDHGEGPIEWLEKWNLRFYNDHTAAKGYLHLRGAKQGDNFKEVFRQARAARGGTEGPQPVNDALLEKLKDIMSERITRLAASPLRAAYALDDEISWGAFVLPISWRINADDEAYERWLASYYGGTAPEPQYVTPDYVLAQHDRPLGEIDFSPLLDRLTYNDSVWAVFVGRLVRHANTVDPETPCGFVGGQSPSIWGGYDYAKLSRKVQFIEAYDLGSSQEIVRSFGRDGAITAVTSHFHGDTEDASADKWQAWYYFAHGNRGIIGWIENWFAGGKPRAWLRDFAPTLKELGAVQGPKTRGARWIHDGVAIYYSHPSIQVSWCLDIEPHGGTWVNRRYSDFRLGTSHTVRKAWENILSDAGLQYDFIAYNDVVATGVPQEYKALILPACYALSDVEAARIREFAEAGGTVIADFACGVFDQHGKGRRRGALDDLFGVEHGGDETKKDFFGGTLWVETDQDKGHDAKTWRELLATVSPRLEDGYAVAERRLPVSTSRRVGRGRVVYMNLSPLRYLGYREAGEADDAHREPFVRHLCEAGAVPWVSVTSAGRRPRNAEVTYWSKDGRTYVFVVQNVSMTGGELGGGTAQGLIRERLRLDVEFAGEVRDMVNERTSSRLGDGRSFTVDYDTTEATFLSFAGDPPRPR